MAQSLRARRVTRERMDRIEDYLRRAEAAETSALHALGPDICRQFLEIAEAWRDLAREAERLAPGEFHGRDD